MWHTSSFEWSFSLSSWVCLRTWQVSSCTSCVRSASKAFSLTWLWSSVSWESVVSCSWRKLHTDQQLSHTSHITNQLLVCLPVNLSQQNSHTLHVVCSEKTFLISCITSWRINKWNENFRQCRWGNADFNHLNTICLLVKLSLLAVENVNKTAVTAMTITLYQNLFSDV